MKNWTKCNEKRTTRVQSMLDEYARITIQEIAQALDTHRDRIIITTIIIIIIVRSLSAASQLSPRRDLQTIKQKDQKLTRRTHKCLTNITLPPPSHTHTHTHTHARTHAHTHTHTHTHTRTHAHTYTVADTLLHRMSLSLPPLSHWYNAIRRSVVDI